MTPDMSLSVLKQKEYLKFKIVFRTSYSMVLLTYSTVSTSLVPCMFLQYRTRAGARRGPPFLPAPLNNNHWSWSLPSAGPRLPCRLVGDGAPLAPTRVLSYSHQDQASIVINPYYLCHAYSNHEDSSFSCHTAAFGTL